MSRTAQTTSSPGWRLGDAWPRFVQIYQKEIWQSAYLKDRSVKGALYAVLRVISITVTVAIETRIASRAAALSFSSLLGLGPLLAIATLVAGFALGSENDPRVLADALGKMARVVAPQIQTYEEMLRRTEDTADGQADPAELENALRSRLEANPEQMRRFDKNGDHKLDDAEWTAARESVDVNPDLVNFIADIITKAQSGAAGALSVFSLILIVLLLFKSIEDTFNDIWGVRQGRSVLMRVVLYWTVLTLGALLFFTAVATMNVSTFLNVFAEKVPGDSNLLTLAWLLPTFSFTLLTVMLTLFYRVIPNTHVFWRAAFIGGIVVAVLLLLNQFVAVLYVKRVVIERSLYGSLAIVFVLMGGLYTFWLFMLTGGIVSYALQNVHFRNSQTAWSTLTHAMRERLSLVVFLTICRRFRECLPPISASHLSTMLKVPTQLLNECLNRLVALNLVTTLRPPPDSTTSSDYLYQPSRPLNRLTLFDFKTLADNFGENPVGTSLEHIEPLIAHYDAALSRTGEQDFFQRSLEQLLDEHPFDESQPPFAMGSRRPNR